MSDKKRESVPVSIPTRWAYPPPDVRELFHRAWSLARDLPGYTKEHWQQAESKLGAKP